MIELQAQTNSETGRRETLSAPFRTVRPSRTFRRSIPAPNGFARPIGRNGGQHEGRDSAISLDSSRPARRGLVTRRGRRWDISPTLSPSPRPNLDRGKGVRRRPDRPLGRCAGEAVRPFATDLGGRPRPLGT